MNSLIDIKSLTEEELKSFLSENGFKPFRAKQVTDWLKKGVTSFDEMKNIPSELRDFLKTRCYISVAYIEKKLKSRYDKTVKYLFALCDGEYVESGKKRFFARFNSVRNASSDRSRAEGLEHQNIKRSPDGYGRAAR